MQSAILFYHFRPSVRPSLCGVISKRMHRPVFSNSFHLSSPFPFGRICFVHGAGHEKKRGEQLKWSSWHLGCTLEVFHGPVTARLGRVFFCVFLFQDFVFINKTSKQLFHFLFLGAPNLSSPGAGAPCALCMVNPLLPLTDV